MKWIETVESLPKACETVLVCTDHRGICTGYLSNKRKRLWVLHDEELKNDVVIAWMYLPKVFVYSECV